MPDGFKSLKDIFNTNPGLKKIKIIVDENDVVNDFDKIFPDLKKIVKPIKVEKGILTLKVENSVWRSELKFKETEIVEKINSFYSEKRISKIKFSAK